MQGTLGTVDAEEEQVNGRHGTRTGADLTEIEDRGPVSSPADPVSSLAGPVSAFAVV